LPAESDASGTDHDACSIALSLWSAKHLVAEEIQDVSVVFPEKTLIDGGMLLLGQLVDHLFERLVKD